MHETITPPASSATNDERPLSGGRKFASIRAVSAGGFTIVLWFVLCRALSSEWTVNEQYSYGWFVPFFAAYLFWLRWEDRPESFRISDFGFRIFSIAAVVAMLMLLPIRLFEVGNPDWRPLGWLHAGIVVALTLLLIWRIGGLRWVKHFAFPVCFIFVAVPWVSPIETPIIQGLMRGVAAIAAETLNLFGVPAQLEGNLIRVSTGLVGVNEACSGVRSLQTSIMIGLLFGELRRLTINRRLALLGSAILIALIANCARALFLVSLAAEQSGSVQHWHDIAGYSIVVAVFVGTMGVASLLARKTESRSAKGEAETTLAPQSAIRNPRFPFLLSAFCFLLLIEASVESWYRLHERHLVPEPGWAVNWPESAPGFRTIDIDEGVKRTLRFDHGREVAWPIASPNNKEPGTNGIRGSVVAYFFRWNAGGSSVLRARAHRPDICLPDAGWIKLEDRAEASFQVHGMTLPFRQVSFRKGNANAVAHTYFCLQEDAVRPYEVRPDLLPYAGIQPDWSLPARMRIVRAGIRNLGQQVLEIVILTPADESSGAVDATFSKLLTQIIVPARRP